MIRSMESQEGKQQLHHPDSIERWHWQSPTMFWSHRTWILPSFSWGHDVAMQWPSDGDGTHAITTDQLPPDRCFEALQRTVRPHSGLAGAQAPTWDGLRCSTLEDLSWWGLCECVEGVLVQRFFS